MASSPFSAPAGPFPANAAAPAAAVRSSRSRSHSGSAVAAISSAFAAGTAAPLEPDLRSSFESDDSGASASSRFVASAAALLPPKAASAFAAAAAVATTSAGVSTHPLMQMQSVDPAASLHTAQIHGPPMSAYFGFKPTMPYDLSGAIVTDQILAMANLQQQQQQQHHHALGSNSYPTGLIPSANHNNSASSDSANLYPFGLIPFLQEYPPYNQSFMQQSFQAAATPVHSNEQRLQARLSDFSNSFVASASAGFFSSASVGSPDASVSAANTGFAFPANAPVNVPQTPASIARTTPGKQDWNATAKPASSPSATPPTSPANQSAAVAHPQASNESSAVIDVSGGANSRSNMPRATSRNNSSSRFKPTPADLAILTTVFAKAPYPSAGMRARLAERLGLQGRQIQFWFQNRRAFSKLHGQPLKKPKKGDKPSTGTGAAVPAPGASTAASPGTAVSANGLPAVEQQ
ncbi:hypothetical protein HDU82_005400 [Entophlyctis luteolus]|nr:hypothetical protein HDU82_005400 [Entophlyctis luteolus]